MSRLFQLVLILTAPFVLLHCVRAQDKSVKPGINTPFLDPNVQEFQGKFEVESREVFARRREIVTACEIQSGQTVADIGAGTGLFTRMFSDIVGKDGRVISVDISQKFLDHILKVSREAGQLNVETLLCQPDSTELLADSVDVAFICDTFHHFEFPVKTMMSLHRALKPGARVILIDFRRLEGTSSDWVLNHVRAGQEVFEAEIVQAGFQKVREEPDLLKENYFVMFQKAAMTNKVFPIIAKHGGVVTRPGAAEQPKIGAKVVFDITADAKPGDVNKGIDRVARLLNLYGAAGLKAADIMITVVVHNEATKSVLSDLAYRTRFETAQNPNLPLIRELQKAGVQVFVCGQALSNREIPDTDVAEGIPIAVSALTVVINKQTAGFSYIPIP